jgi:serum/glucocorticoid-regulated kinase 2
MKEMQKRVELEPDEIMKIKNTDVELLDDGILKGIGFKSFDIDEILGHGAFGKVFKCRLKGSNKVYAMKVLKKAFLYKNKHLKYAITECNILKQAENPFVIKMHYSFQTPDNLYMILDYCSGCDLAYHLNKKQIFDEEEAKFFIAEIICAIEYVHSLDVIYRDLKPENILIADDGHCRLADFGLAKENIGEKDFARSFCGSPAYLPPEMLHSSKGVSKSADIYQIGAVLYEFLVGFPPYYTENIKELYQSIRSARLQVPKYISKEAKDLLNQLLNKRPEKRITLDKVKTHEFFKGLDWDKLMRKEI